MSEVVNITDIGKTLEVESSSNDLYYLVQWNLATDADFLVLNEQGLQEELAIPVKGLISTLFFDTEGNYYSINNAGFIAQYNFETKELVKVAGSVSSWDDLELLLQRLANGNIVYSIGDPINGNKMVMLERTIQDTSVSFNGAVILITDQILSVNDYITSISTEGTITVISISFWNSGSRIYASYVGTAEFNVRGLMTRFDQVNRFPNETGATIHNGLLYTSVFNTEIDLSEIIVRDLITLNQIINIPLNKINRGSIGFKLGSAGANKFTGVLERINTNKTETNSYLDDVGVPVIYTKPGRKVISLIVMEQNIDYFLAGNAQLVKVKDEQYEIKKITSNSGRQYVVQLNTPEELEV